MVSSRWRRPASLVVCLVLFVITTNHHVSCTLSTMEEVVKEEATTSIPQSTCISSDGSGQECSDPTQQQEPDLEDKLENALEFRSFLIHMFDVVDESIDLTKEWRGQERYIVGALLEFLGMDPFLFGKRLVAQDGNWLYDVFVKTKALAPPEFWKVWDEHAPTMDEVNVVVTIDDQAVELATEMDEADGSYFVNQDKLLGKAFLPFRHRGYTPTLLDTFCRVVLGPLKSVAYAIPSPEVLTEIAKYEPLVEVGAGSGYWSAVLQQVYHVDIAAHDETPPHSEWEGRNVYFYHSYTDILPGDCVSLFADKGSTTTTTNMTNRTLLMVWPNNPDNVDNDKEFYSEGMPPVWDADCVEAFVQAGGTQIIFVGEREENIRVLPGKPPESGFCASRKFQTMLQEDFELVRQMELPRWYYSDDVTFWKLKKQPNEQAES